MNYQEKCKKLKEIMRGYASEDVMIAFSGGVDSSLLLAMACEAAGNEFDQEEKVGNAVQEKEVSARKVYAATLHTMLHPMTELEEAKAIAEELGAEHIVLKVDELSEADILMNPKDRCYRCKSCLFRKVMARADELSVKTIIEGTNEDDLHVYRPGIRAVQELGIKSPLAEVHMTKEEVRRLAAEYGVSSSNKPSTPCLATRFPYGTELSYEKMKKVEDGEAFLKSFGFYNVRMRVHQEAASDQNLEIEHANKDGEDFIKKENISEIVRIEVDEAQLELAIRHRTEIIAYMKQLGFAYVTLDLEGFRSGSYDV